MITNNPLDSFNKHYIQFLEAASSDSIQEIVDETLEALAKDFEEILSEADALKSYSFTLQEPVQKLQQAAISFPKKLPPEFFQQIHASIKRVGGKDSELDTFLRWLCQFESNPLKYLEEFKKGGYEVTEVLDRLMKGNHTNLPNYITTAITILGNYGEPLLEDPNIGLLLLCKVDLNAPHLFKKCPLDKSWEQQQAHITVQLLQNGYDVGHTNLKGKFWNYFFGKKTILENLKTLENDFSFVLKAPERFLYKNSIFIRCLADQPTRETVTYFTMRGFNLDQIDCEGHHILSYLFSAKDCAVTIARLLTTHFHFPIDQPNRLGRTALSYALENESEDVLDLIQMGADPNTVYRGEITIKDGNRETKMRKDFTFLGQWLDVHNLGSIEDLKPLLLQPHIRLDIPFGINLETPLIWAARTNKPGFIQTFLPRVEGKPEVVNMRDKYGYSALAYAHKNENKELVYKLLNKGANQFDCLDEDGNTLIWLAWMDKSLVKLNKLIDHGVPIDVVNSSGKTFLFQCLEEGIPTQMVLAKGQVNPVAFVQQVLKHGADPYKRNRTGTPPLYLLIEKYPQFLNQVQIDPKKLYYLDDFGVAAVDLIFEHKRYDLLCNYSLPKEMQGLTRQEICQKVIQVLPLALKHKTHISSGVFIALVLNLKELSFELQRALGRDQFVSFFTYILRTKFPAMTRDYWMNHLLYIDKRHLDVTPPAALQVPIPDCGGLNRFLKIFQEADHLSNLDKKVGIDFIQVVIQKTARETIKNPEEFFPHVQKKLEHVLFIYDSYKSDKQEQTTIVNSILEIAKACPTRWYTGPIELIQAYQTKDTEQQKQIGFDGWYINELNVFRRQVVEMMAGANAHHRAHYFQLLGDAARIYGYEELRDFIDFMNVAHLTTYEHAQQQFIYRYNPSKLMAFTGERIKEHMRKDPSGFSELMGFNRWLLAHLPTGYRTDIDQVAFAIVKKIKERQLTQEEEETTAVKGLDAYFLKKYRTNFPGISSVQDYVARVKLQFYLQEDLYDECKFQIPAILHVLKELNVVLEVNVGTVKAVLAELEKPQESNESAHKRLRKEEETNGTG